MVVKLMFARTLLKPAQKESTTDRMHDNDN